MNCKINSKNFFLGGFLALASLVNPSLLMAQTTNEPTPLTQQTPQITSTSVIESGDNPLLEIDGVGFSKDSKVMINDNGILIQPQTAKKKKIIVQIPNGSLCSGSVRVRVVVGATSSNTSSFSYQKAAPIIYSVTPGHAQAGSVVEIKGDNLSCDTSNNLVTLNDMPLSVLSVNMNTLTVRIPDGFAVGSGNFRLTVSSQSSLPSPFTVDNKDTLPGNGNSGSDNTRLSFVSSAPPGASFAPMFNLRDAMTLNNNSTNVWNALFYGTHQAIIELPFKIQGFNQKALLTVNVREVNGIYGTAIDQKQRFIYCLIQFPRNPEQAYNPDSNPFYWGACAAATEANPSGGFIFNSVTRATGGIDNFDLSKDPTATNNKATMTMTMVAPDLGYYEDYGINYAKAGNGVVHLPKAMTVTLEMNQIQPNLPASKFITGKVTFNDFVNGSMTTQATFANTFSITDVPDFGFGSFR